jgi:hypothetical protein
MSRVVDMFFFSLQLTEMNGKMISGKPLYVAFAQRKEDRKAMLQVSVLTAEFDSANIKFENRHECLL